MSDAKAFSLTSLRLSGWQRQRGVSASATASPSARFFFLTISQPRRGFCKCHGRPFVCSPFPRSSQELHWVTEKTAIIHASACAIRARPRAFARVLGAAAPWAGPTWIAPVLLAAAIAAVFSWMLDPHNSVACLSVLRTRVATAQACCFHNCWFLIEVP